MLAIEQMWDILNELGVEEQTLHVVTDINGYTEETMLDILYAVTGLRTWEQVYEENGSPLLERLVADDPTILE